ncbi:MAG: hypothetical protein PVI21_04575 [Candidatus Woesebacteria bacterium]|jgi:hypothetical protein
MQLNKLLLDKLAKDYPNFVFIEGKSFKWSPKTKTITFCSTEPNSAWLILHEIAHALLGHDSFSANINLVKCESAAWHYAKNKLQNNYKISISDDYIQDCLDTYRDWLHSKSLCPACGQTGIQTKKNTYSCINCRYSWLIDESI